MARIDLTQGEFVPGQHVVIIARKKGREDYIDVVLAVLHGPEYVTWIHNKSAEDTPGGVEATYNGHYTHDLQEALDDFNRRT